VRPARPGRALPAGLLLAGVACLAAAPPAAAADPGEAPHAGQYCPLPQAGEKPRCLAPAETEYREFFAALDQGKVSDQDTARIEATLSDARRDEDDYLALSSLTYGYWRLAREAAARPGADAEIAARLQSWNRLLSAAYAREPADDPFRSAVRRAATDLRENAPDVETECVDDEGRAVTCSATASLVDQLDAADRVGVRGALAHILERWFGAGEPAPRSAAP
jgi:hypothetical protein